MSSAEKYRPRYTVEDYQHWEGDWELWDGLAVSMSPSPFAKHGKVLVNLASKLNEATKKSSACRTRVEVVAEIDWNISDETILRPDIAVLCGPLPEKHIVSAPAIVVEILSDGSRERDLNHKRAVYQSERVPYYLILDPAAKSFIQLRLEDGTYHEVANEQTASFTICESCSFEISIEEAFA